MYEGHTKYRSAFAHVNNSSPLTSVSPAIISKNTAQALRLVNQEGAPASSAKPYLIGRECLPVGGMHSGGTGSDLTFINNDVSHYLGIIGTGQCVRKA